MQNTRTQHVALPTDQSETARILRRGHVRTVLEGRLSAFKDRPDNSVNDIRVTGRRLGEALLTDSTMLTTAADRGDDVATFKRDETGFLTGIHGHLPRELSVRTLVIRRAETCEPVHGLLSGSCKS